jgi:hypothetical protein
MTQRTIQFYGQGLGENPAEITVTFQGQTVFSGPVPTAPSILSPESEQFLLFSVNALDVTDAGSFAVTVTPTVESVVMSYVLANYTLIINPVYTWEQWEIITDSSKQDQALEIISSLATPPFTEAELAVLTNPDSTIEERDAILEAHGVAYTLSTGADGFSDDFWQGDSRANVTLDGVPEPTPEPRPAGEEGDWGYVVPSGKVIAFDLNVEAGVE